MIESQRSENARQTSQKEQSYFSPPSAVTLLKGDGAIKSIGKKFAANLALTSTGFMKIPLATSPGRNGFGSPLFLAHDSGGGNASFDFGLRIITNRTVFERRVYE